MKNLEGLQLEELDFSSKNETNGGDWIIYESFKTVVTVAAKTIDEIGGGDSFTNLANQL